MGKKRSKYIFQIFHLIRWWRARNVAPPPLNMISEYAPAARGRKASYFINSGYHACNYV